MLQHTHLFYCINSARDAGEERHPQYLIEEWAERNGATILHLLPQSLGDGWEVWLQHPAPLKDIEPMFRILEWSDPWEKTPPPPPPSGDTPQWGDVRIILGGRDIDTTGYNYKGRQGI